MDARVRYTKKIIKETFLMLLSEKPLENITVTELCTAACVNRATFYKYYRNPQDLLKKMEQDCIDELYEKIGVLNSPSSTEVFRCILKEMRENKSFYQYIFSPVGDPGFPKQLFHECRINCEQYIRSQFANLGEEKQKWLFRFLTGAVVGILTGWLKENMETDPDEIADFVHNIFLQITSSDIR